MWYPSWSNWDNAGTTVTLGELIESGWKLFPQKKPYIIWHGLFDAEEILNLEQKIIWHFYYREIGQETPDRFRKMFVAKMNEIIPKLGHINKAMKLLKNADDPLEAYNLTETFEREGESTGTAGSVGRFSNTPQGSVENIDDYLTEATKNDSDSSGTTKEKYTMTRKGNIGVQTLGYEVTQYAEAYKDVDTMFLEELECLFLKVY